MSQTKGNKPIFCGDCDKTAPEVTIPEYTVSHGSGRCDGCLHAPECDACGAHAVADKAGLKGISIKLCKGCRKLMGATIIPTPIPVTQQATKPAKPIAVGARPRKPARMAV